MRFLRVLLPVLVLLAGGIGLGWYGYKAWEDRRHREAVERWPALYANGFRGNPKEVAATFLACFREGDLAADYEELFVTARKKEWPEAPGIVEYEWIWDLGHHGEEGDAVFVVCVEGSPPVIKSVYITAILY